MKTKQEIREYQKAYYQRVKKLQLEQCKKEKIKETYFISIVSKETNNLIVEL